LSRPATLYVGLSTTTVDHTGTNITEPSGNNYSRVAVTNDSTSFPAATQNAGKGKKANGIIVQFPTASGPWGTVTDFFISDNASGGNIFVYGELTVHKAVTSGDTVQFAIGNLVVTLL
jgi:hypothetical protein